MVTIFSSSSNFAKNRFPIHGETSIFHGIVPNYIIYCIYIIESFHIDLYDIVIVYCVCRNLKTANRAAFWGSRIQILTGKIMVTINISILHLLLIGDFITEHYTVQCVQCNSIITVSYSIIQQLERNERILTFRFSLNRLKFEIEKIKNDIINLNHLQ